jgi:hypothetical protein
LVRKIAKDFERVGDETLADLENYKARELETSADESSLEERKSNK